MEAGNFTSTQEVITKFLNITPENNNSNVFYTRHSDNFKQNVNNFQRHSNRHGKNQSYGNYSFNNLLLKY